MKMALCGWAAPFAVLYPSADIVSTDPLPAGTFTATDSSGSLAVSAATAYGSDMASPPNIEVDFGRTPTGDVQITLAIPANISFVAGGQLSAPLTYAAPKNFGPKEFYGGTATGDGMLLSLNTGKDLVTAAPIASSAITLTDDSGPLTVVAVQVQSAADAGLPIVEVDYDRVPVGQIVATIVTPSLITFAGGGHPTSPLVINVWTWVNGP